MISFFYIQREETKKKQDLLFYMSFAEENEQKVTLWNVNKSEIHQYVTNANGLSTFALKKDDVHIIDAFAIGIETGETIITSFTITSKAERKDFSMQEILNNFAIEGAELYWIDEEGRLHLNSKKQCTLIMKQEQLEWLNQFREEQKEK